MGKKIKSTVKFRFKKKQKKKKDKTWLELKQLFLTITARDKHQLFSLENGVKKLSLSTPFGEK